jgi:hypothetical protein
MNRSASWVSLGLVACVGGVVTPTPTAHAQTFNDPTFYFWGRYPNGHTPASPKVRQIVKFSLNDSSGGVPYHANVTALAQHIGDFIAAEIAAGRLTNQTVTLLLQNFGADGEQCDMGPGQNANEPALSGSRFFFNEDRLPGVYEWDIEPDPKFPKPRLEDHPNRGPGTENGLARSYRHPFIANALPDDGTTVRAPLRAWMKSFVSATIAEFNRRVVYDVNNSIPDIPHPDSWRWYLDTEPIFLGIPSDNALFLLDQIAQKPEFWSNTGTLNNPKAYLWAFRKPGGFPYTLAEWYEIAVEGRDWPSEWVGGGGAAVRSRRVRACQLGFGIWEQPRHHDVVRRGLGRDRRTRHG